MNGLIFCKEREIISDLVGEVVQTFELFRAAHAEKRRKGGFIIDTILPGVIFFAQRTQRKGEREVSLVI
jgi:hypothetical protein